MKQERRPEKEDGKMCVKAWKYFCLKELSTKLYPPLNRPFCKWPEHIYYAGAFCQPLLSANPPVAKLTNISAGELAAPYINEECIIAKCL